MREAALRLDCEVRLAMVSLHEEWMAEEDYEPGRWHRRSTAKRKAPELIDLIEASRRVEGWRSATGEALAAP